MEEILKTTAERSGDERHSGEHHRHHSHRHHRSSKDEDLSNKRENWRKPHQKKRLLRRLASVAFTILSIIAVLLMVFVAYIYLY